ncbi:FG-GAP and VCBS repeat-containing protein [Actinomadura fibrosa]|uniref:FG-GAP and VCBS repeat-containing protein n=1 Tax=Actinomadura fibrosa TaxID=111802 RepID=A0ABW2XLM9_9ACTN|nr:FG-GAP and VCBS repeat-containing protein [Actinomadura fibrosa]
MTRHRRRFRISVLATVTAIGASATGLAAVPAQAAPRVPASPGDFNGDGKRDLVAGSPFGTANGMDAAGFVTVVYGGASGPDAAERQVITQESAGVPGSSERYDDFGASLASADFDLDGYADLAVVASGEDAQGPLDGGRITLIYGSASGLSSRAVVFGENAQTVSAGDFDRDGKPDLAAGLPGSFAVYRGLASGSTSGTVTRIGSGQGESFRVATTAADFTGDGYADLAYAVSWAPIDGDDYWIRFNVHPGSANGVSATPAYTSSEAAPQSLASGDVNGDGKADLVAGFPDDGKGGQVRVYSGTASGLGSATVIDQDSEGVPGTEEPDDLFGAAVAAGDVNGDGKADVAVGAPEEAIGTTAKAGAVTVLYGGSGGLTGTGAQQFGEGTAGVPGSVETNDRFGSQVSLADLGGDGKADLTVGSSGENGTEGALYVLNGTASGVTTTGIKAFSSANLGVQGRKASLGQVLLP